MIEENIVRYTAAGGVVVRDRQMLVLYRSSHNEVRLPKGHVDPGESAAEAALRETEEESGYADLVLADDLGTQVVEFDHDGRHVVRTEQYFLMRLARPDAQPAPGEAQFEPAWLSWDEALATLTFAAEREWVRRARRVVEKQTAPADGLLAQSQPAREAFFEEHSALLQRLARQGQAPYALFIGCSDSRVMPERLLGAQPGDLFMLRNVANVVPPYTQTEIGIVSALEFAVLTLKVPHIIICGHTDCGGILGLDQDIDMLAKPALSRWLDLVRPAQHAVDFSPRALSPEERHRAIVEQNVIHQLANLQSYPFIREAVAAGWLALHGWVYYLERPGIDYYDPQTNVFVAV
ncbi:MAG TPA: carbonic anhydrase [Anaerolineae bacterium]